MASHHDVLLSSLKPIYAPGKPVLDRESQQTRAIISQLKLQPHIEGGYFVETDRDVRRVPNSFLSLPPTPTVVSKPDADEVSPTRAASTTIHYYLTPNSPLGAFHRNRGRTVHTLHQGRARYVIIHADEVAPTHRPGGYDVEEAGDSDESKLWTGKARIETFIVGPDVLKGERLQWIVEGGKYKASFLLDDEGGRRSEGCLISETVVPGFEYADHDFMRIERAEALLTQEQLEEMMWMVRKE